MGKFLHLHVPVPCHENWNNMTPENQGRFCMSCQKTVVDFTAMADYELIQYFKNLKGNTCGRFTEDQLSTKYALESKRRLNWFKYFVTILIPALLISARSYSQVTTKKKAAACATPIEKKQKIPVTLGFVIPIQTSSEITGLVTNESGESLAGASIFIKGTKEGLATDDNGNFILSTRLDFPLTLFVSYVGFETLELTVDAKEAKSPLRVMLKEKTMEEVVVTLYSVISCRRVTMGGASTSITSYSFTDSLKDSFTNLTRKVGDNLGISSAKIYPNPLRKSSILTIELKNKTNGNYTVLVTDTGGRHLQMEQFSAESSSIQKQIRLKQLIVPGTYIVNIIDSRGKRLTSQKIVVMD